MKTADEFKIYRELADKCRNCDPFKNPQEAASLLKLLAGFLDKLISQKEAERETSRRSDTENLTAAINDLTGIISVLSERVGSAAPKAKSPAAKKSKPEVPKHKHGEYGHVLLSDEEYSKLIDFFGEKYGSGNAETVLKKYIADVDNYVESHGKPYKGYCQTIKNYHSRDVKNGKSPLSGSDVGSHSYNLDLLVENAMNTTPKFN